jgi:hypothetical protein
MLDRTIDRPSRRRTSRRRRRWGSLAAGVATAAVALALGPAQVALAHTDEANGNPATYAYLPSSPAMLIVGQRDTTSGPVATFTAGSPYVAPADADRYPHQSVLATYTLERASLFDRSRTWTQVETRTTSVSLNGPDSDYHPGWALVPGRTFTSSLAPSASGAGPDVANVHLYRIMVTLSWRDDETGRTIGIRRIFPSLANEFSCQVSSAFLCGVPTQYTGAVMVG